MKLASHLWKSRHGIYYIRVTHGGVDIKRSLKTRDPLLAKSFAYKLGINMTIPKDVLAKLLSGEVDTKGYTIKSGDFEINTDGTPEDHANALQALNLVIQLKNSTPTNNTKSESTTIQLWTLKSCIDEYRAERDKTIKSTTRQAWDTAFRQLAEGVGADIYVSDINPDLYATWRMKYIDHLVPTSQDTKNNIFKVFFDWCIERKRITSNPVVSLKIGKNKRATLQREGGRPRLPYTAADLNILFNTETRAKIKKPCLFWLPLIAFYTGARLEELGAIEINDITEYEAGKWQVILKKGKTEESIRTIPLHPEIIKAGLIDYIADVKKTWPNAVTLFPYMKAVKERLTHRASQDYGKYKRNLGIANEKDFHSFRTTLIGCLKRNQAGADIKRAYVGHENEGNDSIEKIDEHDASYGNKTLFLIADFAEQIFPKIDFDKSHRFKMPEQRFDREKFKSFLHKAYR
ncbi:MAG: tyrosine-type recombinase/integrase, partial [Methylotenera sp.]